MRLPTKWVKYVMACGLALGLASLAWTAQENQTKGGKSVTVTGCLRKGDEAGEYSITGEDGKRYGLHSTGVDLSNHLGQ